MKRPHALMEEKKEASARIKKGNGNRGYRKGLQWKMKFSFLMLVRMMLLAYQKIIIIIMMLINPKKQNIYTLRTLSAYSATPQHLQKHSQCPPRNPKREEKKHQHTQILGSARLLFYTLKTNPKQPNSRLWEHFRPNSHTSTRIDQSSQYNFH